MAKLIPENGEIVTIREFAFTNRSGGTGQSNWQFDERLLVPQKVLVNHCWEDDEIGWRYIASAISPALRSYLERNASPTDRRVFFGEQDVLAVEQPIKASYRNRFADFTGSVTPSMKKKILTLAREEFPGVLVSITVRRKKFYYTDQEGYTIKTIVDIEPFDTSAGDPIILAQE